MTSEKQAECVALVKEISEIDLDESYLPHLTEDLVEEAKKLVEPEPEKKSDTPANDDPLVQAILEKRIEEVDSRIAANEACQIGRNGFVDGRLRSYDSSLVSKSKRVDSLSVRLDDLEKKIELLRSARDARRNHVNGRLQAIEKILAHHTEEFTEITLRIAQGMAERDEPPEAEIVEGESMNPIAQAMINTDRRTMRATGNPPILQENQAEYEREFEGGEAEVIEPDKAPIEARLQAQAELAEHWEEVARDLAKKVVDWREGYGRNHVEATCEDMINAAYKVSNIADAAVLAAIANAKGE